jgi:hypothetical protein
MDFKQAQKIASNYGGFIEWGYSRFDIFFFMKIPQSLLPYPIEYIEEALNIAAKSCHDAGDQKMIEAIQKTQMLLMSFIDDEEAILHSVEMLKDQKMFECAIKLIRDFRQLYGEPKHIAGFFTDVPFEKVDFEKLDIPTAYKIVSIYSAFLKNAHMRLSLIFSQKIPESLLPFSKYQLSKALDFYANVQSSVGNDENAETYTFGRTIMREDYIDDEIAMSELVKNLSDEDTRSSIISDIKEFQIESMQKT